MTKYTREGIKINAEGIVDEIAVVADLSVAQQDAIRKLLTSKKSFVARVYMADYLAGAQRGWRDQ